VGGRVKVVYLSQPTFLRTLARKVAGFFLILVLASCGGNSSNDSGGTTATQLQGFYQASVGVGSKEFISLVLPSSGGSSPWYGWYFKGPTLNADPYLYSGNLILGVNGAAQTNGASIRIYESGTLGSRSANFSQSSLNSFQATITNVGTQTSETMTATAQGILQTSLEGTWTGTWSSKGSILPDKDIVLDANGASTSMEAIGTCNNNNTLRLTGSSIYTASITINGATNCDWSALNAPSKTLTGVGFVHLSTIPGKNRLELILLDADGSGISFRGDK
jgi:hypothetical protein